MTIGNVGRNDDSKEQSPGVLAKCLRCTIVEYRTSTRESWGRSLLGVYAAGTATAINVLWSVLFNLTFRLRSDDELIFVIYKDLRTEIRPYLSLSRQRTHHTVTDAG
jgi:hypothetical protein